ncbi:MAG TPA: hypothetical protein VFG69_01040, partial [Nannocystaceae bacterium]|nr:hypothetical protein [Nannocystaceae bacterium]
GDAPPASAEVDILFVVDDSTRMAGGQRDIALAADRLVEGLLAEQPELSYRIAITTTLADAPWCDAAVDASPGHLELSSCRARADAFVSDALALDVSDVACSDLCDVDTLTIEPTTIADDDEARPRPWIEGSASASNLGDTSLADALRCAIPQGISGCAFTQPLEAMRQAIDRTSSPEADEHGFFRTGAHLVVIVAAAGHECSIADERFLLPTSEGGSTAYWPIPEASGPTSGACWNASVECTGGDGSAFGDCRPIDRALDGGEAATAADAVVTPISAYAEVLAGLAATKQSASVSLFAIAGVPADYPEAAIPFVTASDSDLGLAISPVCADELTTALPPVRLRELVETVGNEDQVFSICAGDQTATFDGIAAHVADAIAH